MNREGSRTLRGWLVGLYLVSLIASGSDVALASVLLIEIRVSGNSILSQRDIERTIYPFLGPEGSLKDVSNAALELERLYHARGYPTVGVVVADDAQTQLERGYAELMVYEQRVGAVRVTDAEYFSNRRIVEAIDSIAPGVPINAPALQRDLDRLARRTSDRSITPVLRAGDEPGEIDVELKVEDRFPLHAGVELNNFASPNTSDLRLTTTLSYDNLFQREHSIAFSYQTSPENQSDVDVKLLTYLYRPLDSDAVIAITGVNSNSDVAAIGGTNVLGKGSFLIARGIVPIESPAGVARTFIAGVDYKDSRDTTSFIRQLTDDVFREEITERRIDYFNFMAGYSHMHDLWGGRNSYLVEAHAGIRGVGNERDEFETKRFKGEPNYFILKYGLSRMQPLPFLGLGLLASVGGQLTPDRIIGNEQLAIGGYGTIRGYLEAEALADYGAITHLELTTPRFSLLDFNRSGVSAYGFWDWGLGVINEPLPDEDARFRLSSAGFGMRYDDGFGLTAEALWATSLEDAATTQKGDDRVSFRVVYDL